MLWTSISAVVLGCFYFCPLDCDASVMLVDCAAVETGCMLEKYTKRLHTCCECYNKRGLIRTWYVYQHFLFDFAFDVIYRHLLFFTLGRSVSAWIDYSTTKWEMKLLFLPSPTPLLLLILRFCVCCIAVAAVEKGYAFLLLLIIFLVGCAAAAAGACAAYSISTKAERGTGYCFFLLSFCPLHCDALDVYFCCCS